jgi:hypothetical protein
VRTRQQQLFHHHNNLVASARLAFTVVGFPALESRVNCRLNSPLVFTATFFTNLNPENLPLLYHNSSCKVLLYVLAVIHSCCTRTEMKTRGNRVLKKLGCTTISAFRVRSPDTD